MTSSNPAAAYSPLILRLFSQYSRRYFCRHFSALRLSRSDSDLLIKPNTILYANHPAWWDPLIMLLFAAEIFPDKRLFAPIDANALKRYSLLGKCGLFGIEQSSATESFRFLRQCELLLADSRNHLAITAQGDFVDIRKRPITIRRGLAHLLLRNPHCHAIPVALEYTFWDERLPEALIAVGQPISKATQETPAALNSRLESALESTSDELATRSMLRDPSLFDTLVGGTGDGVGGIYGAWQHLSAWLRGRRLDPAHRSIRS